MITWKITAMDADGEEVRWQATNDDTYAEAKEMAEAECLAYGYTLTRLEAFK